MVWWNRFFSEKTQLVWSWDTQFHSHCALWAHLYKNPLRFFRKLHLERETENDRWWRLRGHTGKAFETLCLMLLLESYAGKAVKVLSSDNLVFLQHVNRLNIDLKWRQLNRLTCKESFRLHSIHADTLLFITYKARLSLSPSSCQCSTKTHTHTKTNLAHFSMYLCTRLHIYFGSKGKIHFSLASIRTHVVSKRKEINPIISSR